MLTIDPSQTAAQSADGATVIVQPNGAFEYKPSGAFPSLGQGQTATDTFTYVIDDSFGSTATGTVTITVTGVEDPPVAPNYDVTNGLYTMANQVLNVPASTGLLSQVYSPDTGATSTLTAFAVRGSSPTTELSQYGAAVTINPDGSFTYDPTQSAALQKFQAEGIDVVDTFEYGVQDPKGPKIDPDESIDILAAQPNYTYNIAASTASGLYNSLGAGPSINDEGNVAFEGANAKNQDDLYIWPPAGYTPSGVPGAKAPQAVSVLDSSFVRLLPGNTKNAVSVIPYQQYGPNVQINDANYVMAERYLSAAGLVGTIASGVALGARASNCSSCRCGMPRFTSATMLWRANRRPRPIRSPWATAVCRPPGVQYGQPRFPGHDLYQHRLMPGSHDAFVGFAAEIRRIPGPIAPKQGLCHRPGLGAFFPSPVDDLSGRRYSGTAASSIPS